MSASREDYVEKITGHLDKAARALATASDLMSDIGGRGVDVWSAKSNAAEAFSSIAQGHNDVAMTYVKLLEITMKAGM